MLPLKGDTAHLMTSSTHSASDSTTETPAKERKPQRPSLEQALIKLLHASGWTRKFEVRAVTGTKLWQVITKVGAEEHEDRADVVVTLSEVDYNAGVFSSEHIRNECKPYLHR